ncbi:hypothetical protein ABBQ38_013397 [Trebouxia sp. C0009 RCD-2024]
MRSLEQDVPRTISRVLSTHDWQGRKELIDKVFKEDAKFWHLFFQTVNRKELFGVYQMWGAYNFKIDVDYTRVVPDRKNHRVVVDLIETINVWWTIFPYLGIPIHLNMHVVLGVEANPDPATRNELIFTYQEDHIFWVESYLALNPVLTLGLGPFFLEHLRPLAGSAYATIGNLVYSKYHDTPDRQGNRPILNGFTNIEGSIQTAIQAAYGGSPKAKWEHTQKMYSENAEFWHPLFIVKGRENIFGAHMFWSCINRKTNARVKRIVLGERDNIVMVDLEQQYWPYLWLPGWPPLAIWVHVILTLEDARTTRAGKVITKHEDHVLWLESLVLRNLGPFSRFYDSTIRRCIGIFFCWLGNLIYEALAWCSEVVRRLSAICRDEL